MSASHAGGASAENPLRGVLGWIERVGNRLPDPATLFVIGCILVALGSAAAWWWEWTVPDPLKPGESISARNLLAADNIKWMWLSAVKNFLDFHPLGVVLVAMLGIGVAERTGLLGAMLKIIVLATPAPLLTPAVVFAGVMSSAAADAGYVILPPLAAAVFAKAGRAPLAGLAAVTFGVAGGFSANLLLTSLDPLLQGLTEQAARITNPEAVVDVSCNWYFMIASTGLVTLIGWIVCRVVTEPRFDRATIERHARTAGIEATGPERLDPAEHRGLIAALAAALLVGAGIAAMALVPGWPLHGSYEPVPGRSAPVWTGSIVPIILVGFLVPGIAYGMVTGAVRSDRDVASRMGETMASMGAYIVLAFFAGQFIKWFEYSNLGRLIAIEGIDALKRMELSPYLLVTAMIVMTSGINLLMSSASAKWA
ncbi:MAG: AbgT family transporter, partial [Phycisphaerae bacterium]|nr:AbgT family transporter [Phycisphaerae bacterium]